MKINLIKVRSFTRKRTLMAIMRTFIFLLCTTVFSFATEKSFSQEQVIIDVDKVVSVDEVFNIIQKQTKYRFLYPQDLFSNAPKVNLKRGPIKISKLLSQSFSKNNFDFEFNENNTILIKESTIAPVADLTAKQGVKISGTVTDAYGQVLPGANIIEKGTSNGTQSDFDGKFSLTVSSAKSIIVVSYIGFLSQEVNVNNQTIISIVLQEDSAKLDEVVIVGYGTTKKVNLTGAVGIAKGEVLENRAIATVGQGLQGVLPGLNITVNNGDPANNVDFNIRGFESINGGSPLILVDNVPMDLNQINPNDIESISVLKDAASAAIYGARAAFGVILVTTKKGKKGKVNVTLSTEQTVTAPIFLVDPVTDPLVYMTSQNDVALLSTGGAPIYDSNRLADALAYSQNPTEANAWSVRNGLLFYNGFNDYQDKVVTNQSFQKKYDLSVSGASDEATYYASIGYLGKQGYLVNDAKNQNFERFNALLKAEFKVNNWLSLDSKIIYTNTSNDEPHTYAFDASVNSVNRMSPIEPLKFPDLPFYRVQGDRDDYIPFIGQAFANNNTIPYLEQGSRDTSTRHDTWFTQGLTITPFDGFVLKSDFSYNSFFQSSEDVASKISVINGSNFSNGIDLGA
ncbi:SusC/RagA family TonB-linked outer membrane protein [Mariniflexile sp.]|uniref:SusC/RagA family TonB-linked outer membrane protein n=1 Tax=Mariniflexile sp. TaxID=1979402 RepID=UPI0040477853